MIVINSENDARLADGAALLNGSKKTVALTGAGISVGSGIPDFRSPGGLWTVFAPDEYATIEVFYRDPEKAWELYRALGTTLKDKVCNPAHQALAELERRGQLAGIVTQNVDNLHQQAGNSLVLEIHDDGSATMYCGTLSHGQGHQTTYAMLVSARTGIPVDRITLVDGDTDRVPQGGGTGGSRSLQLGGSAVSEARVPPGATLKVGRTFLRIQPQPEAVEVAPSQSRRFGEMVAESLEMREVFAVLELAGALGAFTSGTLSDRIGRRRVLLAAVASAQVARRSTSDISPSSGSACCVGSVAA